MGLGNPSYGFAGHSSDIAGPDLNFTTSPISLAILDLNPCLLELATFTTGHLHYKFSELCQIT